MSGKAARRAKHAREAMAKLEAHERTRAHAAAAAAKQHTVPEGMRAVPLDSIADQLDEVDPRIRGVNGPAAGSPEAYKQMKQQEAPPMTSARITAKTCKVCGESKPLDQFPQFGPFALRCLECAAKAPPPSPGAAKSRKQRARNTPPPSPSKALAVVRRTALAAPAAPPSFDNLLVDLKLLREERDELRAQVTRLYSDLQAIVS